MGAIQIPKKVCLFTAICYNDVTVKEKAVCVLVDAYGELDDISDPVDFTFTNYYESEMGSHLKKQFYAFKNLIDPNTLSDVKVFTNEVENHFTQKGKRTINIDPGYIEISKLVLATTKNYSHRIYLANGIYGDVQLCWHDKKFQPNPWT